MESLKWFSVRFFQVDSCEGSCFFVFFLQPSFERSHLNEHSGSMVRLGDKTCLRQLSRDVLRVSATEGRRNGGWAGGGGWWTEKENMTFEKRDRGGVRGWRKRTVLCDCSPERHDGIETAKRAIGHKIQSLFLLRFPAISGNFQDSTFMFLNVISWMSFSN